MTTIRSGISLVLLLMLATACSSEGARRAAYEAAYRKSCLDRGAPSSDCDPQHPSYEEYRKQHQDPQQAEPAGR